MKNKIPKNISNDLSDAVLGILLLLSLSVLTFAQSTDKEPTLQESLDFIAGKSTTKNGCGNIFKSRTGNTRMATEDVIQSLTFEGTIGTFKKNYITSFRSGTVSKEDKRSTTIVFDLKDLINPKVVQAEETEKTQINPNCPAVVIKTYNGKKVIKSKNNITGEEDMYDAFPVYFWEHDKELAERVAKAFAHAIKLAGGKKEAFE